MKNLDKKTKEILHLMIDVEDIEEFILKSYNLVGRPVCSISDIEKVFKLVTHEHIKQLKTVIMSKKTMNEKEDGITALLTIIVMYISICSLLSKVENVDTE